MEVFTRTLIVDPCGDALDLALRAQEAGHEVKYYTDCGGTSHARYIGKGLLTRVMNPLSYLRWADLIILADNQKFMTAIDNFRAQNPAACVFGPTRAGARLEIDRLFGMKMLARHGIPCPATRLCRSYEEAAAYVKKCDARLVCKPCADADKALSYAAKSPEDMLFMLKKWNREGLLKKEFVLQDFKEGTEFGVGVFVGKFGFGGPFEENFEHKKLMPREIGPATGEMGTVDVFVERSKLADIVLKPLEKELVAMGYTGDIDVNVIVDAKGGVWPLEFTARLGFPALQIQTALFPEDPVSWMYDLAAKDIAPEFQINRVALGVALCMPPFPYEHAPLDLALGFPVYGVTPYNRSRLHPYHIMRGEETEWATAGTYALVVTGTSETVSGAAESAYRTVGQITIPGNPLYRHDIGKKLSEAIPELQKHGFARQFVY